METAYYPKTLTPDELQALSREVKQALLDLYGDRLNRVILFGSYARGDFHANSDVDYMLVLNDTEVRTGQEIWVFGGSMSDLTDKYNVMVSVKPTSLIKYSTSDLFLYQEVRREGIAVI